MVNLPIFAFEEQIIKAVQNNSVTVVIGEIGSGKSTQLSQMLFRRGFADSGVIAVTQPTSLAAVSAARHVAQEMKVHVGEEVGFAVPSVNQSSEKTKIKYITDGMLLLEYLSNRALNSYSVVIVDEAHERCLNMDIFTSLVKRLVKKDRLKFRVVITSATLDGEKVSAFFDGCPVLNVPGKLFPVEVFYRDEKPKNYIEAALEKAIDIHSNEPEGDMLIFMSCVEDMEELVDRLGDTIRCLEEGSVMDAVIYPLDGSLSPDLQLRVFRPPPPNCRRIIVATNIAQSSVTFGVVYVIDPGYVKQRQYNFLTEEYSLDVMQISRGEAIQRAGRAGRNRSGKCYRLYPFQVYSEEFMDAAVPEIQRSSLTESFRYLKSFGFRDTDIRKLDFLDPPSEKSVNDAFRELYLSGEMDRDGKTILDGIITMQRGFRV